MPRNRRIPKFLTEDTFEFPQLERQVQYSLPYAAKRKEQTRSVGIAAAIAAAVLIVLVILRLVLHVEMLSGFFRSYVYLIILGMLFVVYRSFFTKPVLLTEESISWGKAQFYYVDIAEVKVETQRYDKSSSYGENILVISGQNLNCYHTLPIDYFSLEDAAIIFNAILSHQPNAITSWDIQALADCAKRIN